MLISHDYKFIFIKTRKTAGSSIEGALQTFASPPGYPVSHQTDYLETSHGVIGSRGFETRRKEDPFWAHSSAEEVRKYLGDETFNSYTKIYSVRNPYDKVVSWFWFVAPPDLSEELDGDADKTRWFFHNWLLMRPALPIDLQFYKTRHGPIDARVVHYESIETDLLAIAEELGLDMPISELPKWKMEYRKNKDMALSSYYDDDTRALVCKKFQFDFKRFGYSSIVPE